MSLDCDCCRLCHRFVSTFLLFVAFTSLFVVPAHLRRHSLSLSPRRHSFDYFINLWQNFRGKMIMRLSSYTLASYTFACLAYSSKVFCKNDGVNWRSGSSGFYYFLRTIIHIESRIFIQMQSNRCAVMQGLARISRLAHFDANRFLQSGQRLTQAQRLTAYCSPILFSTLAFARCIDARCTNGNPSRRRRHNLGPHGDMVVYICAPRTHGIQTSLHLYAIISLQCTIH